MDRAEQRKIIRADSPHASAHAIEQYLSALAQWHEADANIREFGSVAINEQTGAPFDNPFCAVRDRAYKTMAACKAVNADRLWSALISASS